MKLRAIFNAALLLVIVAVAIAAGTALGNSVEGYGLTVPILIVAAMLVGCYSMLPADEKQETRDYWGAKVSGIRQFASRLRRRLWSRYG